jgi:hypothetical protein
MNVNRKPLWTIVLLLLLAAIWLWQSPVDETSESKASRDDLARIEEAFAEQRSDLWVESGGTVVQVLRDDTDGSAHQRFLVELANGQTLLFAHNIDLAPRVPLARGDRITFRGEYEWNDKGGVIHWTHRDPRNRSAGGWIEHDGRRYR